jgi:hypothetical protein
MFSRMATKKMYMNYVLPIQQAKSLAPVMDPSATNFLPFSVNQ